MIANETLKKIPSINIILRDLHSNNKLIVFQFKHFIAGYSYTGDSNGYDYNTVTNNGYLGSKDSYQNNGNFYGVGDSSQKLSNHISSHSFNAGNQGGIGSDIGNSYKGYSANDQGSEYGGYSNNPYENSENSDSYTRSTSAPFRGYSGSNGESTFNAYSSGSSATHKDTDFGQYAASSTSSSKRIPAFSGYSRPILENYPEGSDHSNMQGYHSAGSSYSESDHAYSSYSPGGLEYSFGKQKDELYKGGNKYSDIYSIPSETRYTRGNAGHANHNHDVPSYMSSSGSSGHFLKVHGPGNVWYSSGKPDKYSYKSYLSRYAPNTGVTYLSRERDGYYTPFSKGGGKLIIIKDTRPSYAGGHVYSDEPSYAGGYRSKSTGYGTSPNFSGYSGSNNSYDDGPTMLRRYRNVGGLLVQKAVY